MSEGGKGVLLISLAIIIGVVVILHIVLWFANRMREQQRQEVEYLRHKALMQYQMDIEQYAHPPDTARPNNVVDIQKYRPSQRSIE